MKWLVFDISNVLYRTFFVNRNESPDDVIGLANHSAMTSLFKFYKQFKPDKVVIACDSSSWRKQYTSSNNCISQRPYKGNRRKNMTPIEKKRFEEFISHVVEFENLIDTATSMLRLKEDGLEADDLIAGFVEAHDKDDIVIISRDKDLCQMLDDRRVIQHDPTTDKSISLHDAISTLLNEKKKPIPREYVTTDFFMFAKQLRGDTGDNVQAAYPGIRKTKIYEAWKDPYVHEKIMNHRWTNENDTTFVVKDLFEEGELLMNLRKQPENIRVKVFDSILTELDSPNKFNYFEFMKYCGKYKLKKIAESADKFTKMLSS